MRLGMWLLLSFALCLPQAYAGDLSEAEIKALFEEGHKYFERGLKSLKNRPAQAKIDFNESLMRYEKIVQSGALRSSGLYMNLGNVHMMREELGHAVLNYRRAAELNPHDARLLKNLQVARSRVKTSLPSTTQNKIWSALLFWHRDVSAWWRFRCFQLCLFVLGGFWLLALIRPENNDDSQMKPIKVPAWLVTLVLALALISLLSLVIETSGETRSEGVVLKEVSARKGPDAFAYQASFSQALSPGVEFEVLERRDSWLHIVLKDGRECWLPESCVGFLDDWLGQSDKAGSG